MPKPRTMTGADTIIKACRYDGVGLYFYDVGTNSFEKVVESISSVSVWEMQRNRVIDYLEAIENERFLTYS